MTDSFSDRLLETAIVLTEEQEAIFRKGVGALAQANLSRDGLLGLVRLSFNRVADAGVIAAFTDQLTRAGIATRPREKQKIATLATLILIERFARPIGKRAIKNLLNDSIAAVAIRVLRDQRDMPVHPDLFAYADYWHDKACDHLRGGSTLPPPPRLPDALVPAEAEPEEASGDTSRPGPDIEAIHDYVGLLGTWLGRPSWPTRIVAIEEQQSYAWWLLATRENVSLERFIVAMCEEVLALCRFLPGPPAAPELMRRRLERPEEVVDIHEVARLATRQVSSDVGDLCVLVNGVAATHEPRSASEAASALYNERLLLGMTASKEVT